MASTPSEPMQDEDVEGGDGADPRDERIAELERERDENLASFQRATADYQNLRRRLASDIDAAVARAKRPLHQDLLLVLDYLDMALATPCTTHEGKNLLAGVQLTRGQLASLLEREGIQRVPDATTFDPTKHEAVERVETDEEPVGRVLDTLRPGYTMHGQILRPAQVRVVVEPRAKDASEPGARGSSERA